MTLWRAVAAGTMGAVLVGTAVASELRESPESVSSITFGDERTLFVADSHGARVYAYQLPAMEAASRSQAFNLRDFGSAVSSRFGVAEANILYHDIAVHPRSGHAYIALSVVNDGQIEPYVIRADPAGELSEVGLDTVESTSFPLSETPDESVVFWRDIPATTFTITDIDYASGSLFIAGLSSGEFASTLRRISYPFEGRESISRIEMYHAVHNQIETRAPIRAMAVMELDGAETIVAAYTCTPLVTVPVDQLVDGARVRGKTVAELGYGNTPLEVVPFEAMNMTGESESFVLVVNRERAADLIRLRDLEAGHLGDGLTEPSKSVKAGVPSQSTPLAGVLQMADQDPQFLLVLQRNLDTGGVDLVSIRKGAYLRLSNFVSEYNFPDYTYSPEGAQIRQFQNMLKIDEGFPELLRDAEPEK